MSLSCLIVTNDSETFRQHFKKNTAIITEKLINDISTDYYTYFKSEAPMITKKIVVIITKSYR